MKLIDILARELEKWPEGAKYIYQDGDDGFLKAPVVELSLNKNTGWWENCTGLPNNKKSAWVDFGEHYFEIAEDWDHGPVTHGQWMEARAAYLEGQKPRGKYVPGKLTVIQNGKDVSDQYMAAWDNSDSKWVILRDESVEDCKATISVDYADPEEKDETMKGKAFWYGHGLMDISELDSYSAEPPEDSEHQDPDGWIEWHGDSQPVENNVLVDVRFLCGEKRLERPADDLCWNKIGGLDYEITHYRLHREEKTLTECLCDEVEENIKKAYKRPPMPKGEPKTTVGIDWAEGCDPCIQHDTRPDSPQEAAYADKLADKKAQHEAACLAEHVRREQDWANVLKTADPHAYLLGVGQYREGE